MDWVSRKICGLLIIIFMIVCNTVDVYAAASIDKPTNTTEITSWQLMWDQNNGDDVKNLNQFLSSDRWVWRDSSEVITEDPSNSENVWLKFRIPTSLTSATPAIYINKIYAQDISLYVDNKMIYDESRNYSYDAYRILLPIDSQNAGKEIVMKLTAQRDRLGMAEEIIVGDYQILLKNFVKENLVDIIFGGSIIFIAVVMLLCTIFLSKEQVVDWFSLNITLLAIGTLIITYSPFLYTYYGSYGLVFTTLFDIALLTVLPGLTFIFENMIGTGYRDFISKFRKLQMGYSLFCLLIMIINLVLNNEIFSISYFFSVTVLGIFMIIQACILVISAGYYAISGNKDAVIIAMGFGVFTVFMIMELLWFYAQKGNYELFLWKWGVMGFVMSLIVLLGRKFAINHRHVVEYSKELERFNNELQRSEKMDIISELAASVAHEVRNPLQVTKGFLQLLEERSQTKEKEYLKFALEELERASSIITDFLTFAKPELEQISIIDISWEFKHIEGILMPLVNFEGGAFHTDVPDGLTIRGNSSKFKQALINMIKNSIEALGDQGLIRIWAYKQNDEIVIHIHDNGEGMEEEEIIRLGEPYYSNKIKGTGLGLMVTFRIIEAMQGSIRFISEKGVGTEVIIRFPAAYSDEKV